MFAGCASTPETLESPIAAPVTTLVRLLDELRSTIEGLSHERYVETPVGRHSGSIGAHVRHSLDHVAAFLEGTTAGVLSYDRRLRGTSVETSREAALGRISCLTAALLDLDPLLLQRPLRLDVQLDASGTLCSVISTAGRELAYVISHTIHHNATMGVLLTENGMCLPERFGVAAATPPQAAFSCAQ
jgi:uncharacterized damage-inducible protein DinB